ncbi:nickel ABC transporter, nickel/metallophore periplasmic binding protein, partial [Acinetobacter baumannii]|nr:nickel ABC transporter, nickel/metallophore periplasmic binding protein [Acinetobacter baumannii]
TQQVADTLFAPSVPYAPQDLTPRRYDPTKARALLEQAGWQQLEGQPWRQKAGQPLAIELAFIGTDALAKSMAEIIQANLRQVGVQVTLV